MDENRMHAYSTVERLAFLERDMRTIVGNGQPGRLTNMEVKLDQIKWWIIASCLLGSTGGNYLGHILGWIK